MSMTGEEEALFLDGATTLERGRSVGILCEVVLVLAGGVSSSGTGNIDTFPEAERATRRTFPACVDTENVRGCESRAIDAEGLPSDVVPS